MMIPFRYNGRYWNRFEELMYDQFIDEKIQTQINAFNRDNVLIDKRNVGIIKHLHFLIDHNIFNSINITPTIINNVPMINNKTMILSKYLMNCIQHPTTNGNGGFINYII